MWWLRGRVASTHMYTVAAATMLAHACCNCASCKVGSVPSIHESITETSEAPRRLVPQSLHRPPC